MFRRVSAAAVAATLFAGMVVVGASPASAAPIKPTITATGDVKCGGGVTMWAAGFSQGGSGSGIVTAKFKARVTCQGSTGNPAVKVKRAIVTGQYSHHGLCSTIPGVHSHTSPASTAVGGISLTWKAVGGKINPTHVGYSNHDAKSDGWQLPAASPAGTSNVSGSYAGSGPSKAYIAIFSPAALQGMCSSPKVKAKLGGIFLIEF